MAASRSLPGSSSVGSAAELGVAIALDLMKRKKHLGRGAGTGEQVPRRDLEGVGEREKVLAARGRDVPLPAGDGDRENPYLIRQVGLGPSSPYPLGADPGAEGRQISLTSHGREGRQMCPTLSTGQSAIVWTGESVAPTMPIVYIDEMPDPFEIAARIREARKAAGYTQDGAATELGVSSKSLGRWEGATGKDSQGNPNKPTIPDVIDALAMCRLYGVTPEWIVYGETTPQDETLSMELETRRVVAEYLSMPEARTVTREEAEVLLWLRLPSPSVEAVRNYLYDLRRQRRQS